jgi:hypothetical protein
MFAGVVFTWADTILWKFVAQLKKFSLFAARDRPNLGCRRDSFGLWRAAGGTACVPGFVGWQDTSGSDLSNLV